MKNLLAVCGVLALVAFVGCSGSHGSTSSASPALLSAAAGATGSSSFGEKVCADSCRCAPDRVINVASWQVVRDEDLCGLPWACKYRCSVDCASIGAK